MSYSSFHRKTFKSDNGRAIWIPLNCIPLTNCRENIYLVKLFIFVRNYYIIRFEKKVSKYWPEWWDKAYDATKYYLYVNFDIKIYPHLSMLFYISLKVVNVVRPIGLRIMREYFVYFCILYISFTFLIISNSHKCIKIRWIKSSITNTYFVSYYLT